MAGTDIDQLQIKIKGSAQGATKSINTLVNNLDRLQNKLKTLDTSKLNSFSASANKVSSSSKQLSSSFSTLSVSAQKSTKSFTSLASAFGKFYASYFLVIRGIKSLWNSIEKTADYVEAFNYYTVSFGKVASKWDENWANYGDENARNYTNAFVTSLNDNFKKLSGVSFDPQTGLLSSTGLKNLGLNLQEVTQYAAQLGSMMDAVGQSGETTLATTNAFVKLAGDISSLYNIDYETAGSAIRSVLQGQSRAGYKFGWDTTMASLQAMADKLDLSKAVSEMSQMEKQQLRILTILEQSRVAWGDQSNTINTLANQIRMFKNNLSETSMLLGQLFVPLLQEVIPIVNGLTIALKSMLSNLAVFLGIKIQDTGQGFGDLGEDLEGVTDELDSATESANKLQSRLQGFDKLNVLKTKASTGDIGSNTIDLTEQILQATQNYQVVWDEAYKTMENRAQEIAENISKFFEPISKPLQTLGNFGYETLTNLYELFFKPMGEWAMSDAIPDFVDLMSELVQDIDFVAWGDLFENVFTLAEDVIEDMVEHSLGLLETVAPAMIEAGNSLADFFGNLIKNVLIPVWDWLDKWIIPIFTDVIGVALKSGFENISMFVDGLSTALTGVIDFITGVFTADWEQAIIGLSEILEGTFGKAWESLQNTWGNVTSLFNKDGAIFDGFTSGVSAIFESVVKNLLEGFNSTISLPFKGINSLLNSIRNISFLNISPFKGLWEEDPITIPKIPIPTFETGGFPEDGFFFANHNELVGQFNNGKTAVANNEQIVAGIQKGVRDANAEQNALLREQNSLLRQLLEKEVGISSRDVFNAVRSESNNYTRRTGQPAFV